MKIICGVTENDVCLELQRVLNFSSLKNSPILGRFLKYIVMETINGRANCIKEYSIAIDVLDRAPNFSPHDDAIVRIHAGRLRRILNEYYLTEGVNDPCIISIPKGCYVPEFKPIDRLGAGGFISQDLRLVDIKPTVAVFPFKIIPQGKKMEELSLLLQEELSAELSRFREISVIGYYSTEMITNIHQNVLEAGRLAKANYIVTGTFQCNDERMRIRINLMAVSTGEVLMTKSLEKETLCDVFEIEDEIISEVVNIISGYYSIIFNKYDELPLLRQQAI